MRQSGHVLGTRKDSLDAERMSTARHTHAHAKLQYEDIYAINFWAPQRGFTRHTKNAVDCAQFLLSSPQVLSQETIGGKEIVKTQLILRSLGQKHKTPRLLYKHVPEANQQKNRRPSIRFIHSANNPKTHLEETPFKIPKNQSPPKSQAR